MMTLSTCHFFFKRLWMGVVIEDLCEYTCVSRICKNLAVLKGFLFLRDSKEDASVTIHCLTSPPLTPLPHCCLQVGQIGAHAST